MEPEKTPKHPLNLRQKIVVIALDACLLAEVCLAMYMAAKTPEEITPVFVKTFFAMVVPTLVAGFAAVRLLRGPAGQVKA